MLLQSHSVIFKRSLGKFLHGLKKASTAPLFKKGDPQDNHKAVRLMWLVPSSECYRANHPGSHVQADDGQKVCWKQTACV